MSELDYEPAPALEADVPMVRPWLGRALTDWTRGCYPPRRGVFLVWGWLLPVWGVIILFKFFIYVLGVALLLAAAPVWAVAELITYHHRSKRAQRLAWINYMLDLHDESPPE